MPKERRTREQKIRTSAVSEPVTFSFVKREFESSKSAQAHQAQKQKEGVLSNQTAVLASTKKDLFKTFILASAILAAEAVLYLTWK